jgi:hypothetical protein
MRIHLASFDDDGIVVVMLAMPRRAERGAE